MAKLYLILFSFLFTNKAFVQKSFKIIINNKAENTVNISYISIDNRDITIALNKNSKNISTVIGKINEPVLARLKIDTFFEKQFFIEPKTTHIEIKKINSKYLLITDSKLTAEMNLLDSQIANDISSKSFHHKKFYYDSLFITKNNTSFYTIVLLNYYYFDLQRSFALDILKKIPTHLLKTPTGKSLQEKEKQLKKITTIGKHLNEFLLDTFGKKTLLKSILTGKKFYLIDFWASWCFPCRREMPELLNINDKLLKKDIALLLVTQDNFYTTWLQAINDDKTRALKHYFDKNQTLSKKLGIDIIPLKILLDKQLNVIGVFSSKWLGKLKLENIYSD